MMPMKSHLRNVLAVALLFGAGPALAQQTNYLGTVFVADSTTPTYQLKINSDGSINVDGSFSATLAGFTPSGNYSSPLSVSNSSSRVALPSGSPTTVAVYNTGSQAAFCKLGNSSVTATTSDDFLPGNSAIGLTVGSNVDLACITATGATTVNISGGSGLLTGFGGGGGSGGGGGAVYGPTAGGTAAANPPVIVGGTVDGTTTGNVDNWKVASGLGYVSAVLPSASVASGAFASGSVASGAFASGSLAAGSMVDLLTMRAAIAGTGSEPVDVLAEGCQYNSSLPTFTNTYVGGAQCDASGRQITVGAGTAGTAAGGVVTVQGVASMTPVQVSQATAASLNATVVGTGTFAVQATLQASATTAIGKVDPNTITTWGLMSGTTPGTAPTNTLITGGIYNSSPPGPTTGQTLPFQLDSAGNLNVNIKLPVTIASNQATLAVTQDVSQLFNGVSGTAATVTKTKISVASATTTTVVALTSGKKTRVLAMYLVSGAACNINWQSHTTTTNADGVQDFAANAGIVLPFNPIGWFDTTSGEALDLVTSTNAQVGGYIITTAI